MELQKKQTTLGLDLETLERQRGELQLMYNSTLSYNKKVQHHSKLLI